MKSVSTLLILFAIPFILLAVLFNAVAPLLIQYFFKSKSANDTLEFPYLTSWEEAA